jgi:hypothetical protein
MTLFKKCKQIYEERNEPLKDIDFEFHLLMMEEFTVIEETGLSDDEELILDASKARYSNLVAGEASVDQ